jgi:hypothetical protein
MSFLRGGGVFWTCLNFLGTELSYGICWSSNFALPFPKIEFFGIILVIGIVGVAVSTIQNGCHFGRETG